MEKTVAERILYEVKRVVKDDGKIIVVEWEKPNIRHIWKRILFSILYIIEPNEFKDFIKMDLKEYFKQCGFLIEDEKHRDFCTVLRLKKFRNGL